MKRTANLLVLVNREALRLMAKTDKINKKYNALRASYMNQLRYKQYIKRNIRTRHK